MGSTFSIEDAKKAFISFGCLHFHMARELPDLYKKYQGMQITQEMENGWIREELYYVLKRIYLRSEKLDLYWSLHSDAVKLASLLKDKSSLNCLYKVINKASYIIPVGSMIMCAEDLLGRNDIELKRSVIFFARELGDKRLASNFINLALFFIKHADVNDENRRKSAIKRANETVSMLR